MFSWYIKTSRLIAAENLCIELRDPFPQRFLWTLSNICDGAFWESSKQPSVGSYFHNKTSSNMIDSLQFAPLHLTKWANHC